MHVVPPDLAFGVVTRAHRAVFEATSGRLGGRLAGMPVVRVTTTGRRSGQPRHTMLSAPINDPDRVVLVASKGGAPAHPAWYLNLQDDPKVRLMRRGRTERMVARTADPDERDALWLEVVAAYRGYAGYQRHTDRTIPVVILTPDTTDGQGPAT